MLLHPCGGSRDEKPRLLSRNEEFLLQLLRRLLEDSFQLSAPSGIAWAEESGSSKIMFPFGGIPHPMTNEQRSIKVQPPHWNKELHWKTERRSQLLLGLTEAFVGTELLLSFSLHAVLLSSSLFCRCSLQENSLVNILHSNLSRVYFLET